MEGKVGRSEERGMWGVRLAAEENSQVFLAEVEEGR